MGWLRREGVRRGDRLRNGGHRKRRLLPEVAGFDQLQKRRIAALKAHDITHQAGPHTGRRGNGQRVGYTHLDLGGAQAFGAQPVQLIYRDKLKINPVIRQQPQSAVPRIFNGDCPFRPQNHFETKQARVADLFEKTAAAEGQRAAGVENGSKLRPYSRDAILSCEPLGMSQ